MTRKILLVVSTAAVILAGEVPMAEGAAMVQITAPEEGSTITGTVPVSATADPGVTSVTFEWSTDGTSWVLIGTDDTGPSWTASWETRPHTGFALLRATATDGLTAASDTNSVTVDNVAPAVGFELAPSVISPNGDGRRDGTTLILTSNEAALLTVRLLEASETERRRWSHDLTASGTAAFTWDGTSGGTNLPDDAYILEATATDRVGLSTQRRVEVTIDTVAPTVSGLRLSPEPASGIRPLTFRFRSSDRADYLRARIEFLDRLGPVAAREEVVAPGHRKIVWSPRHHRHRAPLPGLYRARLTVSDDGANISARKEIRWRLIRAVRPRIYRRVAGAGRRVALTIDDCHYPEAWSRMLTVLRRLRTKATFFCPGDRMLRFPHLTRRTVREGHSVAAHGWDHSVLPSRPVAEIARQLRKAAGVVWKLAHEITQPYFRPPYGAYDRATLAAAAATGHPRVVMWDVNSGDIARPGASVIVRNAVAPARRGSIILLHTIPQTAEALPAIITGLRRKGLRPVTVAELFRPTR